MSSIRDRRKQQSRVEAIAEALDLNHTSTTSVPQILASAGVSSSDNATNLRSLPDDHSHTQAKDDSTNQHLDLHQGSDGQNLCSGCNEIKDIFDFEEGIPARSWRTLYLTARVDRRWDPSLKWSRAAPKKVWKVTHHISKTCPFCSFLMDCASRMAIHTAVDLKSYDWSLAVAVRFLEYWTGEAISSYWSDDESLDEPLRTQMLQLKLCQNGDTKNPFMDDAEDWEGTHLILPVQAYDDSHGEVSDTIDWELIEEWLDTCHAEHDNGYCNDLATTSRENIPSFCLIDCETETIIPAAEISHPNYVTLSYVWGASTTSPQVLDASTSLPVLPDSSQRPKVVNDAMKAVQKIGYRYLWVDRYCIPQSDHNAKSKQIKNMGKIYSMSVLTIIAAAGNDAEYGLPGVSSPPTIQPVWTTIHSGNRAMPVIHFEPPNNDILKSIWNSRGWTYQEALLSKRRLVFTDRHVYFQCESIQSIGYLNEDLDCPPRGAMESQVFPFRMYDDISWENSIWDRINDYTERMLSYEEDTINAVQGVLESFRDICDVWFFYGLPVMGPSSWDTGIYCNIPAMPDVLNLPVGTFRTVNSGTQGIVNSLFWSDCWGTKALTLPINKTRFSDQSRSEVRRAGFPTWTWAGWRTVRGWKFFGEGSSSADFQPHPFFYMPDRYSFSIRLSYEDKDLSWPRHRRNIRHRSEITGRFPNFLVITGPVFDVTVTYADREDQRSSSDQTSHVGGRYTSPPFLAQSKGFEYCGPPFSPDEVKGNTIHLVALCLFSINHMDVVHEFKLEDRVRFHSLMLRLVGEDAYGQIYERVTCTYFTFPPLKLADLNLREMELRIR